MLQAENLSYGFYLKDINFNIKNGSTSVLVGDSSSGRKKLFSYILKQKAPKKGELMLEGQKIEEWPADKIQQTVGWVFAESRLYPLLTVRENLEFFRNLTDGSLEDMQWIINKLELRSILNKRIENLSNNQKIMVGIARSLLTRPSLLFLNEPLTNLSSDNIFLVQELINILQNQKCTLVFSTFGDPRILELCNQIIYMEEGTVINQDDDKSSKKESSNVQRIPVKKEDRIKLIDPDKIVYIEAESGQVKLNLSNDEYYINYSLEEMEDRLINLGFFRCHRSYLVNVNYVKEIIKWSKNSYELVLDIPTKTEQTIPLSKYRVKSFKEKLNF